METLTFWILKQGNCKYLIILKKLGAKYLSDDIRENASLTEKTKGLYIVGYFFSKSVTTTVNTVIWTTLPLV